MIRTANLLDVPWLLEQLRAFDKFFGARKSLIPENEETATKILEGLIITQPFFIASDIHGRMGFIAGALSAHPYNPELIVLSELFWWVDPKFRGTTVGARLFNHFRRYGEDNADWVIMTLEAESPIHESTLTRQGFKPYERSYLLEVTTNAEESLAS